jgi:hypothetical protein
MGTPSTRTLPGTHFFYHVHVICFIQTRRLRGLLNFSGEMSFAHHLTSASKGNGLDLDGDTLRQLLDGDAGASRLVGEVLLVDRVHLGEVIHGGDEDIDLVLHV